VIDVNDLAKIIAKHERMAWHDYDCNAICDPNGDCGWRGNWDNHPLHVAKVIAAEIEQVAR
jgi:hypothetical protein